jgi:hypothetical protein
VSFFPDFVWTVRDFMLELKLNGEDITSDDYLENALKLIPGTGGLWWEGWGVLSFAECLPSLVESSQWDGVLQK